MVGRSLVSLMVVALLLSEAGVVEAAPKSKAKPAARAKSKKAKATNTEAEAAKQAEAAAAKDAEAAAAAAASKSKEEDVKAAGTATTKGSDAANVKVKEDKEGVKTYKFETVEVEGRLKSPQVIYFLRRVRAEFDAGALGHRSFLGELSDSRRSSAFR
jgi:flagellar hook-length control protein FliK